MKPAVRLFLSLAVTVRRIFLPRTFTAAEAASCLASVIRFRASSSDSTPLQDRKRRPCAFPLTPEPLRSSQKKTQPLIAMPNVVSQNPPIAVAPVEKRLNAAVLDASRYVRVDFDYPDLDVFFLAMENSATITLNESNFDRELTQDDKPMIVDFWAEWCGPCKMIAPLLDEIAREKAGTLKIAKVNVDENQSLSARYNIRAIPARCFFKNGQLRDQVIGVCGARRICSAGWKHWLREFSRGPKIPRSKAWQAERSALQAMRPAGKTRVHFAAPTQVATRLYACGAHR